MDNDRIKKNNKSYLKRLLSLLLSLLMIVTVIPMGNYIEAQAAANSYSKDYRCWSQNKSGSETWMESKYDEILCKYTPKYSWMKWYGCGLVAYAKLLYETGINSDSSFNPDVFFNYCVKKGYVSTGGFTSSNGQNAVVNYAKSLGNNYLSYVGYTNNDCRKKIKDNAKNGYYSFVRLPGHYVLINNAKTKDAVANGKDQIYFYQSYGGYSYKNEAKTKTGWKMPTGEPSATNELKDDIVFVLTFKYTGTWLKSRSETTTNNSATLKGVINNKTPISKWGYFLSTDKNALEKHDGTANTSKTHKTTAKIEYKKVNDWSKSPKKTDTFSTTITKAWGNDLKPNTTYYYRYIFKVNNNWHQSKVYSFTTKASAPGQTTIKATGATDIAINGNAVVSWSASASATSYSLDVYKQDGTKVGNTISGITTTTYAIPSEYFSEAGNYYVKLTAKNSLGSTMASGQPTFTVHENVNVVFYDTVGNTNIGEPQSIPYGGSVTAPADPTQDGHTFIKWNASLDNIKEDTKIETVYSENYYTVTFVDSSSGKILKKESVKYKQGATAPNVAAPEGYVFAGWNVPFSSITEDTTVNTNYKWYNDDYPVFTKIDSISKETKSKNESEVTGYSITAVVNNPSDEDISEGRIIASLKTETGYQLTETESSAFSVSANSTKTITVFVPFNSLAYQVDLYTVNSYTKGGTIAAPVNKIIDNSSNWSEWIEYTGEVPVTVGVNEISDVETQKIDTTLYSYRDKSTTTSYNTSMSGWTRQSNPQLVSQGQSTLKFVSNFPSGFDKSNKLYTSYNKAQVRASENETTKIVVNQEPKTTSYIYWHWCYGKSYSTPQNHYINWSKTSKFCKFHAFERTSALSWMGKDYDCFKLSDRNKCADTYWWLGAKSGTNQQIAVKTEKYTTYKKLYTYYKWSDWSDYSTTPVSATSNKEVRTMTETKNYYRYKSTKPASDVDVSSKQIVNINANVGTDYAGKEAVVFIYKYNQSSDYTNEFIGNTVIGDNGEIIISNAKLREEPSVETGDFTIVASIAGNTNDVVIGKIEAPKPKYTVTFYDFDGETVIDKQVVEAGETAVTPNSDSLHVEKGYRFTNWDKSTVNVQQDLIVLPQSEKEQLSIVFINWKDKEVKIEKVAYGDEIITPSLDNSDNDGCIAYWDMSGVSVEKKLTIDGEQYDAYIATEDTVISSVVEKVQYNTVFISPSYVPVTEDVTADVVITVDELPTETTEDGIVIKEEAVIDFSIDEHDDVIDSPVEVEENDGYIFYGWRNIETGEYLEDYQAKNDGIYYPVYQFSDTTCTPDADVATGEYIENQTVTLSTETENAVIYYTTDGTNPKTSSTAKEYTEPITLTNSCNLMFYATSLNRNDSAVVSMLYAINTDSSGAAYHIVTVYNSVQNGGYVYQALIREARQFDDSVFDKDVIGYTYNGLYFDEEYTEPFYADEEYIYESTDIYAKYTQNQYKVTFVDYDDSVISTATQTYNEEEIERPTPAREGFVFIGWENDADLSAITEDITLKAKYCPIDEYATVSLNKSTSNIIEGQVYTKLVATVTPENLSDTPLTWVSSNPDVLTVDADGVVTAISKGTATITVIVDSTGESASCEFIVSGDYTKSVVLGRNSYLNYDSEGYIRELKPNSNSVSSVIYQFNNDAENLAFFDINSNSLKDDALVGTGSVVRLMDNDEILDESTFIMTGDINGDGYIGNADVSMLMQWLVEKKDLSYEQQLAGDVNGDGNVDNKDATVIARYLVGKESI